MPILHVYGLTGTSEQIRDFREQLKDVVASYEILEVKPDFVSVYILHETAPPNAGNIAVEIKILAQPERTFAVQQELARLVCNAVRDYNRTAKHANRGAMIEVFVYPFDPRTHVSVACKLPTACPPPAS